ncbi:Diguanylate cyclase with PAS/PAC sensor [Rubrivivax sp. A210]|uniref:sensor domain-containing diguanylate cyclase n=1 Tax=Rubrivivax sp. A210 TaxID=2772301 RepID=UPI001918E09A|nr:diguanylate cyclase [Rubrivivax sp. A210]CAD5374435.1 Diguanylate cyclase with PAS/PAC sensor [Rubrivivax sp. A210]
MALISFNRIGHRILAVVGLTVTLGLVAIAWFYVNYQERAVLAQNERNMLKLTETVSQNLQSVMLAGYADIAQSFANRLHKVEGIDDFHVLRVDGLEAFGDNRTIQDVNRRRGDEVFRERDKETEERKLAADNPQLLQAVESRAPVMHYTTNERGERSLRILAPIVNQKACHKCHSQTQAVRGVILLGASLQTVEGDIYETRKASILVLAPTLLATLFLTGAIMRRSVVRPIEKMTHAMKRASAGELDQKVPVKGQDELAQMAGSFNTMTNELLKTYQGLRLEQDKLTTIILGAREAIIVTDATDQVVLVNPAATRLLGKSQDRIVEEGFLKLFDEPLLMEQWLEEAHADNGPHTLEYNSHVLSVHAARINDAEGKRVGSAALLRDITEEKRLEDELRRLSNTDGLTLLYNRRYLDEALQTELERAKRYHLPLSVLLFDVDHFKRFNDAHGHDMGDRVLKEVARLMRAALRGPDSPCRYGGEEFVAILPNTNKAGAYSLAERLRQDIERLSIDGLRVTASIGIAEFPDIDASQQSRLIEAADAAMYQAKRSGRNRVCIAHSVALDQGS